MYTPTHFEMSNDKAIDYIKNNSFATMFGGNLVACHLPLLYEEKITENKCEQYLLGHLAKLNDFAEHNRNKEVLITFCSHDAYISPIWYQQSPNVPTWNYIAVHVKGTLEICNESETSDALTKSLKAFESNLEQLTDIMPDDYLRKLSEHIIGIKINISEIKAKKKLGQNKPQDVYNNLYQKLKNSHNTRESEIATYMMDIE